MAFRGKGHICGQNIFNVQQGLQNSDSRFVGGFVMDLCVICSIYVWGPSGTKPSSPDGEKTKEKD